MTRFGLDLNLRAVKVAPVSAFLRPDVVALRVSEAQVPFVGEMPQLLQLAEDAPCSEPMAVLLGEQVIGYYRLDFTPGAIAFRDFGRPSAGLRGFFIGAGWQGQGHGTAAVRAMKADLNTRHPECELLALTVNVRNPAARQVYLKTGFVDSGELYFGGAAGPQHVMVCEL